MSKSLATVSFTAFEAAQTRAERIIKRFTIAFVLSVAINAVVVFGITRKRG